MTRFTNPRILFIAAHRPKRSPSQRFRFEQYIHYLTDNGFDCELSYLISEKDDQIFYRPGNITIKTYIFLKSAWKRFQDIAKARDYDIIFVQREAFMTGSVFFEKLFKKSGAKLIFDFDDAIWHFDVSSANKKLGWLKNPGKTSKIISISNHVIAGNNFLADYAKQNNNSVTVIPTTIDTEYHKPIPLSSYNKSTVCIGWTGSMTTIKHFRLAENVLIRLKTKYGSGVSFKLIGDGTYHNHKLELKGIPWSLENEVQEFHDIDIGIMPLPDDEWSKGKCGFKGLQYMAMEIPPVMSPVGVNLEIISEGENGFLAAHENEWFDKLSVLIENPELRREIGINARQTVIERYSVDSQKGIYLKLLQQFSGD